MNVILFDNESVVHLYPLTLTRSAADLRCGILTIAEKWEKIFNSSVSQIAQPHLLVKYKPIITIDNYFINGKLLPSEVIVEAIRNLNIGEALVYQDEILAYRNETPISEFSNQITISEANLIHRAHHIFTYNASEIKNDFVLITANRKSEVLSKTNVCIGAHPIFLEEGVKAEAAIFNTSEGPIYLAKDSEVMEGAMIRGPFALCEHATVKMGAKIYSATTIGPHSKVGGEVSNSIIFGFSNKGHDGFLGNSVLGEWCNLGADTNNSNLKNNYEDVKLWNYTLNSFERTGLQFCGLIMGDHSKCGINTMFNTGTVIGVSANIFGSGFPRNFVPSFSWGGSSGFETYKPLKAFATAEKVMQRRGLILSETEKNILNYIFELESNYRSWERGEKLKMNN